MEEQLISFKTAELAKEKGFTLWFKYSGYVYDLGDKNLMHISKSKSSIEDIAIYASSQSLLQKWLRESYNIVVLVVCSDISSIFPFRYKYIDKNNNIFIGGGISNKFEFYEEALEKGLQEALKLI